MSQFTSKDHRFAMALGIGLGEDPPLVEDAEPVLDEDDILAQKIAERLDEDEEEPTIRDWQEYSEGVEKEAAEYYRKLKATERNLNWAERKLVKSDSRNRSLRFALGLSMALTSLTLFIFVQALLFLKRQ